MLSQICAGPLTSDEFVYCLGWGTPIWNKEANKYFSRYNDFMLASEDYNLPPKE